MPVQCSVLEASRPFGNALLSRDNGWEARLGMLRVGQLMSREP